MEIDVSTALAQPGRDPPPQGALACLKQLSPHSWRPCRMGQSMRGQSGPSLGGLWYPPEMLPCSSRCCVPTPQAGTEVRCQTGSPCPGLMCTHCCRDHMLQRYWCPQPTAVAPGHPAVPVCWAGSSRHRLHSLVVSPSEQGSSPSDTKEELVAERDDSEGGRLLPGDLQRSCSFTSRLSITFSLSWSSRLSLWR